MHSFIMNTFWSPQLTYYSLSGGEGCQLYSYTPTQIIVTRTHSQAIFYWLRFV